MEPARITYGEKKACERIGMLPLLVNWDRIPRKDFEFLCRESADIYNSPRYTNVEILRALSKIDAEFTAGRYLECNYRGLDIASQFQDFWNHIGHIHGPIREDDCLVELYRKFPSSIASATEIWAWLQKRHTNEDWLWWCLGIFNAREYYGDLIEFKRSFAKRGQKFRINKWKHEKIRRRVNYWAYFANLGGDLMQPRAHIKIIGHIPRSPRAQTLEPKKEHPRDKSPKRKSLMSPREWTCAIKFPAWKINVNEALADAHWERDSSPRPCRCGEDPCWCVDSREIYNRADE